jgi:hypothetical protein
VAAVVVVVVAVAALREKEATVSVRSFYAGREKRDVQTKKPAINNSRRRRGGKTVERTSEAVTTLQQEVIVRVRVSRKVEMGKNSYRRRK